MNIKEQAYEEAKQLFIHATEEEKNKLFASLVDACDNKSCIYGLLTDYCFSKRALELICSCSKEPYYNSLSMSYISSAIQHPSGDAIMRHFTALEVYIYQEEKDIPELVEIIKTNSL